MINPKNYGCAEAENQGTMFSKEKGDDFVWLLNNDVVLHKDALLNLVKTAQSDNSIAVLVPAIYSFEKPDIEDNIGYSVNFWIGYFNDLTKKYDMRTKQAKPVLDVDTVQGCAILIRVSIFEKVGMYYASYGAYYSKAEIMPWFLKSL